MKAAWLACGLGVIAQAAAAGFIRLETVVLASVAPAQTALSVVYRNTGDSPARRVEVQGRLAGQSQLAPPAGLPAGETADSELDFQTASIPPGHHVAEIRIRYCDQNGYPYSSVTVRELDIGAPAARLPVAIRVEPVVMREKGRLAVTLQLEKQSAPISVRLRVLAPDDVSGEPADRLIELFPGRPVRVETELTNRKASGGSTYPVFAIVSQVSGGSVNEKAAVGVISVEALRGDFPWPEAAFPAAVLLAALFLLFQRRKTDASPLPAAGGGTVLLLALITLFLVEHLHVPLVLLDTTTAGGDTPAHLYLASHLKQTLFGQGEVVSWANGWWCGFPMFRYYFPLPYMMMAGLGLLMPINVAFKVVTVLGILLLPLAAWLAGRLMRLPRPVPVLLAAAMIPFLFVRTHSMWGVNVSSTLAGMIANSLSFPLMLLTAASAWRDAEDGRFRCRTALGWALTLMSHFFTSVMGGLTVLVIPFILARERGFWKTAALVAGEGLLAALMTAWWWIPLMARRDFSMDFGTNWPVSFADTLPPYALWLLPFTAVALFLAARRSIRALWLFPWMGGLALLLFWKGSLISPVFVNVRLWPFCFFALLALAACGFGLLAAKGRRPAFLAAALTLAALGLVEKGERQPSWAVPTGVEAAPPARPCSMWNYEGLERKPQWPVFQGMLGALAGTPGRLAYELNPDNTVLGSVRVFEAVPHLIGKPVLEGGLVNSAAGSMFAYYLQSESSLQSAGAPEIVNPASFNPRRADLHFRLFNVSHFMARSPEVREGFAALPGWTVLREEAGWTLFAVPGDHRYVHIPRFQPVGVMTTRWKECGLEWLYTEEALEQPFAFLVPGSREAKHFPGPVLTEEQFSVWLEAKRAGQPVPWAAAKGLGVPTQGGQVRSESIRDGRIAFDTPAPGQPHLVASMYDPDWRSSEGTVFQGTPGFLLIYPDKEKVELAYGRSAWVWAGLGLAWVGWLIWAAMAWRRRPRRPAGAWRAGLLKMMDATLGPLACRLAGFWRQPAAPAAASSRILVIRPGGMGDMILLIPVLKRLMAAIPDAAVEVVCERRNREVLSLSGLPVTILEADARPLQTWWRLRRGGYRAVVDTEQFHHLSALLARVTGAPVRIGFKLNPLRNPLYTHLIAYDMDGHEGVQFMRLLEPLGAAGAYEAEGCLKPDWSGVRPAVREELTHLAEGRRIVALHAGGTRIEKRWGSDRFGSLAAALMRESGVAAAWVGGPEDRLESQQAARLAGAGEGRQMDGAGRLSLAETAWILSRSGVFVGGDSGVAHLAVALGVRTVVLFGPGDPLKWGLEDARHRVIRQKRPCAPCALFGYQKSCPDRKCLREIGVARVKEAVQGLLPDPDGISA